jgi:hypothetical protein
VWISFFSLPETAGFFVGAALRLAAALPLSRRKKPARSGFSITYL